MKLWKQGLIYILILILILFIFIIFLINTNSGTHLTLSIAKYCLPNLTIQTINGSFNNLTLTNIHYITSTIEVNLDELHLELPLTSLLHRRLYFNNLTIKNVKIVAKKTSTCFRSNSYLQKIDHKTKIKYIKSLILNRLNLYNINLVINNTAMLLTSFTGGVIWQDNKLTLTPAYIDGLTIILPEIKKQISNHEKKEQQIKNIKKFFLSFSNISQSMLNKPILPYLPELSLPVNIDIVQLISKKIEITGAYNISINYLLIQVQSKSKQLYLKQLKIDSSYGSLTSEGKINLIDTWPLRFILNGNLTTSTLKNQKIKIIIDGNLYRSIKLMLNLSGPIPILINLNIQPSIVGLPFYMTLESPKIYWPIANIQKVQANEVNLVFRGKIVDYTVELQTSLVGNHIPPILLSLRGRGNNQQFILNQLHLITLEGVINLTGWMNWNKTISWHSHLTLSGINIPYQYPKLKSKVMGTVTTSGYLHNNSWKIRLMDLNLNLKGQILDQPLIIHGSLSIHKPNFWNVHNVQLMFGKNEINLHGFLSEQLHLDLKIDGRHLNNTLPGLSGSVWGSFRARGNLEKPKLFTKITAKDLQWDKIYIGHLDIDSILTRNNIIQGNCNILLERIKKNNILIHLLQLKVKGTSTEHQLNLNLQAQPFSWNIAIHGSFDLLEKTWRGVVKDNFLSTPSEVWNLTRSITINYFYKTNTLNLVPDCWNRLKSKLFIPTIVQNKPSVYTNIDINHFNLSILNAFIKNKTKLIGEINGSISLIWNINTGFQAGKLILQGQKIQIHHQVHIKNTLTILDKMTVEAELKNNCTHLQWLIELTNHANIKGDIHISNLNGQQKLSGIFNTNHLSIEVLNTILNIDENICGIVNTNLHLSGNLHSPQIFGDLKLKNINLDSRDMPIQIQTANIAIFFNGNKSSIEGIIQTTKGDIIVNGHSTWNNLSNWYTYITVKGEKIRVIVPPTLHMDISPQLVFEKTPNLMTLMGHINIPWAHILIQNKPRDTINTSSDEILLDNNLQPLKPKLINIPITSNITIHLGKNVTLTAYGLQAFLNGDLKILKDDHSTSLTGQIDIPSGRFYAYTQDLTIRKGMLQFSKLLDQPYLYIEAIRSPKTTKDNITVGVRVTGLASDPKIEVFSEPKQTQQETISYLLHGQQLSTLNSENKSLTSVLVGLGLAQSEKIINQIGRTLKINHLALNTMGIGNKQKIEVSANILPNLEIKYGIGIFDPLSIFTVRYHLMPKLYIEAVASMDQDIGMLYQFNLQTEDYNQNINPY
ncbi:translocation/assembly module TamB domain-containing protein [Candidatus Erwinia haradaeae]|uniref:Translocation and assembly module subunit TamB n=1 Tax=Candidatus Erwinia haradaeae TaxID=1922217 RepID=A0A803FT61_9GAMM|nr:translocation/assembly module TamB domain-containing protein [Candidatus Erwinia haradaeae]VFP87748.1 Translocation and assembly module subunit TamB [Candidatus Erwinia haradaeae]